MHVLWVRAAKIPGCALGVEEGRNLAETPRQRHSSSTTSSCSSPHGLMPVRNPLLIDRSVPGSLEGGKLGGPLAENQAVVHCYRFPGFSPCTTCSCETAPLTRVSLPTRAGKGQGSGESGDTGQQACLLRHSSESRLFPRVPASGRSSCRSGAQGGAQCCVRAAEHTGRANNAVAKDGRRDLSCCAPAAVLGSGPGGKRLWVGAEGCQSRAALLRACLPLPVAPRGATAPGLRSVDAGQEGPTRSRSRCTGAAAVTARAP